MLANRRLPPRQSHAGRGMTPPPDGPGWLSPPSGLVRAIAWSHGLQAAWSRDSTVKSKVHYNRIMQSNVVKCQMRVDAASLICRSPPGAGDVVPSFPVNEPEAQTRSRGDTSPTVARVPKPWRDTGFSYLSAFQAATRCRWSPVPAPSDWQRYSVC